MIGYTYYFPIPYKTKHFSGSAAFATVVSQATTSTDTDRLSMIYTRNCDTSALLNIEVHTDISVKTALDNLYETKTVTHDNDFIQLEAESFV